MAVRISDVMRQRADGECQLVGVLRVAKQRHHKVAAAHVVGQVREKLVARWVVADVLNHASAVCIGTRPVQFLRRQVGIAALEQRHDRVLPGEVDQLLVSQQRIGPCMARPTPRQKQDGQCDSAKAVRAYRHRAERNTAPRWNKCEGPRIRLYSMRTLPGRSRKLSLMGGQTHHGTKGPESGDEKWQGLKPALVLYRLRPG